MSRVVPLIGGAVFAALGGGMLWAGFHLYAAADLLIREGLVAEASVIAVRTETRRTREPYHGDAQGQGRGLPGEPGVYTYEVDIPTLRFVAHDGAEVEVDGPVHKPADLAVGEMVPVRYLADDPPGARMSAELDNPVGIYALWALGSATLLPGLIMVWSAARRRF